MARSVIVGAADKKLVIMKITASPFFLIETDGLMKLLE